MRSYRTVTSIGTQCLTGTMMQNALLKTQSGPFDWIFSSLGMVADCIEDNFSAFLNKRNMTPIPLSQRPSLETSFCDHAIYRERYRLLSIFNHSDPLVPENYEYLQRCVRRFRATLRSREPNLLLAICDPDRAPVEDFNRLCQLADTTAGIEIIAIIVREATAERSLALVREIGRHRLFDFFPTSHISGIQFADQEDSLFIIRALSDMIKLLPARAPGVSPKAVQFTD